MTRCSKTCSTFYKDIIFKWGLSFHQTKPCLSETEYIKSMPSNWKGCFFVRWSAGQKLPWPSSILKHYETDRNTTANKTHQSMNNQSNWSQVWRKNPKKGYLPKASTLEKRHKPLTHTTCIRGGGRLVWPRRHHHRRLSSKGWQLADEATRAVPGLWGFGLGVEVDWMTRWPTSQD